VDPLKYNHADFGPSLGGISYYYNRALFTGSQQCGQEQIFNPLPGQVRLRELTACTPTSEGPKCVGGANAGKSCHLGATGTFAAAECPGSTCQDTAGTACRVEIPISDGGKTAPELTSEYWITTLSGFAGVFDLTALTGNTMGGTSAERECTGGPTPRKACTTNADCGTGGTCDACLESFKRRKPSMGWRYVLPAARRTALGLPAGATYVRWDRGLPGPATGQPDQRIDNNTAFRIHQDDAAVCCIGPDPGTCLGGGPFGAGLIFSRYPLLWRPACTAEFPVKTMINEDNFVPDWVFEAGRNSRFFTDTDFEVPGQVHGVCRNNRTIGCTRTGNECAVVADTCDFREAGFRIQVAANQIRDNAGDPNPNACGSALAVLRGTPAQGCMLLPRYPVDGDPGQRCRVFNYGVDSRVDANCDGVADVPVDKCPFLSEWDQAADTDGDCAIAARCRGDECECGDSTLDGRTTVADIVETNVEIFSGQFHIIADSNSTLSINVSDLVATNVEIFNPDSSTCRQITSIRCGNNVVNPGEACDNGARCQGGPLNGTLCDASGANPCGSGTCQRLGGDGCNPACRVESGWTCTGSPSVCTQ
jgi:hypothetical protein